MAIGKRVSGSSPETEAHDPETWLDDPETRRGSPETSLGSRETRFDDPEAQAKQICLRLLTAEPRTRAQLAQVLHRKGVPDEIAESVLSRFADAGLINDAAFARAWVESRHHSRGLSRRSLSAELKRRGIDGEEIREAVDALDPDQETATARRLVEQKMASTRGQPPQTRARRVASLLARKGYPPGLTFRLIKEAMQQEGPVDLDLDAEPYIAPEDEPLEGSDLDSGYSL